MLSPKFLSFVRTTLGIAALAFVTACTSHPSQPKEKAGMHGLVVKSRSVGKAADYLEVVAVHRSYQDKIELIELISPKGERTRADQVRNDTIRGRYRGGYPYSQLGLGFGTGGYSGVGIGVGFLFPLGGGYRRRPYHRTRATFKVPDPASYRNNPARWKIAITVVNRKTGRRVIVKNAPAPTR